MSKLTPILVSLCVAALMLAGYECQLVRVAEQQLQVARDEAAQQEKRAAALQGQVGPLQAQVEILQLREDGTGQSDGKLSRGDAASDADGTANATGAKPADGGPIPASQIAATRRLTPISAEELAQRVQEAYQRTPEALTQVSMMDLPNMPNDFEWGSGTEQSLWRMIDSNTYVEIHSDGGYSVFTVLGHTEVNGIPGVIATKDDGSLDAFIPDKGSRMILQIRLAAPQSQWMDFRGMQNVQ